MKFASCRAAQGGFLVDTFSKEYNKTTLEKSEFVEKSAAAEIFRNFDYIDFVCSGREMLYFSRNYPPVKNSYLRKIVAQDIESETPFKEDEMLIEVKNFQKGSGDMNVFAVRKDIIREALSDFDDAAREKVRSIVPEEVLFFKSDIPVKKAIFVNDDYSLMVLPDGQIVCNGGLNELRNDMLAIFGGEDPQAELDEWLKVAKDLSSPEGLSDIEVRIRRTIISFFEKTFTFFAPFAGETGETAVFTGGILPDGTSEIIKGIDSSQFSDSEFIVYDYTYQLELASIAVEDDSIVNFAVGDFAYKGGFAFLKKRAIIAAALYFFAVIMLIFGMEIRKGYLDSRIEEGENRTNQLMKEVIGKEMPSLRQALSIMDKTIKGDVNNIDKKSVYPYSALYIMEVIFPYFTFENSTIEVSEISIKEEGKIRVVGTSNSLEDINKFTDLLEQDPLIDEINRGQINTRGEKSSFNISFNYAGPKKEDPKAKKSKKKGKENSD
ncbi:hypothetical protein J6Z19_09630 [bacterium]|nr:hypothetical protein [bacterium]